YLTKPVRSDRLRQALQKVERFLQARRAPRSDLPPEETLVIQDRGRAERVPLSEVLYLKSEFKYLTVRTASRSHIYDGSLAEFEERYRTRFVRVHRNALVARAAIRALEKYDDGEDAEGWALRLDGIPEPVVVSRRQLSAVRDVLKDPR
ncbi:MAG: LytTR family transcriptional regulator, partial [Gammaproteobacteria bacterium]|nr:LytTR family transcriptional regulator [Gammaproteobacteria bacterium]